QPLRGDGEERPAVLAQHGVGALEVDGEERGARAGLVERDLQATADRTAGTVARGQVPVADGVPGSGTGVGDGRDDPVRLQPEIDARPPFPEVDQRVPAY